MTDRRASLLFVASVMLAAGWAPAQKECFRATQREDGSWPATEEGDEGAGDLRVTALVTLALLGDGSSSRNGPNRSLVKRGANWIVAQADERGRFGLATTPGWTLDHAICTYAIAEETRRSGWRGAAMTKRSTTLASACDALARELRTARPTADRELRLWVAMIAHSLSSTCRETADDDRSAESHDRLQSAAAALESSRRALPALPAADSWRDRVVDLLLDDLTGVRPFPLDAPPAAFREQPLEDPLATFYLAAAILRRGGAAAPGSTEWMQTRELLSPLATLVKLQRPHAPGVEPGHAGTWDPIGRFGARNGRVGTTAAATLSTLCFFRDCRLSVASP